MYKLRSVGVLSVAKIMGGMYALLGLVLMPIFIVVGLVTSMAGARDEFLGPIGMLAFGIFAPLAYGAMGFVFGAIAGLLYNLMAKWLGGIELNIQAPVVVSSTSNA